mgnify:CR=1
MDERNEITDDSIHDLFPLAKLSLLTTTTENANILGTGACCPGALLNANGASEPRLVGSHDGTRSVAPCQMP